VVLRQTRPHKIAAFPAVDECCQTPRAIALNDLPGSQLATDEKYVTHFRFEYNLWPSFAFGDEVICFPFDCVNQIGRSGVAAGVGIEIRGEKERRTSAP
jgi:hypothetical protein